MHLSLLFMLVVPRDYILIYISQLSSMQLLKYSPSKKKVIHIARPKIYTIIYLKNLVFIYLISLYVNLLSKLMHKNGEIYI